MTKQKAGETPTTSGKTAMHTIQFRPKPVGRRSDESVSHYLARIRGEAPPSEPVSPSEGAEERVQPQPTIEPLRRPGPDPGPADYARINVGHFKLSDLSRVTITLKVLGTAMTQAHLRHKELVYLMRKRKAVRALRGDLWSLSETALKEVVERREWSMPPPEFMERLRAQRRSSEDMRLPVQQTAELWPAPFNRLADAWDEVYLREFPEVLVRNLRRSPGWREFLTPFSRDFLCCPTKFVQQALDIEPTGDQREIPLTGNIMEDIDAACKALGFTPPEDPVVPIIPLSAIKTTTRAKRPRHEEESEEKEGSPQAEEGASEKEVSETLPREQAQELVTKYLEETQRIAADLESLVSRMREDQQRLQKREGEVTKRPVRSQHSMITRGKSAEYSLESPTSAVRTRRMVRSTPAEPAPEETSQRGALAESEGSVEIEEVEEEETPARAGLREVTAVEEEAEAVSGMEKEGPGVIVEGKEPLKTTQPQPEESEKELAVPVSPPPTVAEERKEGEHVAAEEKQEEERVELEGGETVGTPRPGRVAVSRREEGTLREPRGTRQLEKTKRSRSMSASSSETPSRSSSREFRSKSLQREFRSEPRHGAGRARLARKTPSVFSPTCRKLDRQEEEAHAKKVGRPCIPQESGTTPDPS